MLEFDSGISQITLDTPHVVVCGLIEQVAQQNALSLEPRTLCKHCLPKTISWTAEGNPISWAQYVASRQPRFTPDLEVDQTSLPESVRNVTELTVEEMRRVILFGLAASDEPVEVCNFVDGPHITSANEIKRFFSDQENRLHVYQAMIPLRTAQVLIENGRLRGFHELAPYDPFIMTVPPTLIDVKPR